MKRKGLAFIPIILIGFCIVTFCAMYIIYITKLEINMTYASRDKIQSNYCSETKINMTVYDRYYCDSYIKPFIVDNLRYPLSSPRHLNLILKQEHIDDKDSLRIVNVDIYNKNNRKEIIISTESNYSGSKTSLLKKYNVINRIFEEGNLPLVSYDLDEDICDKLSILYDDLSSGLIYDIIPSEYYQLETYDHEKIIFKTKNSTTNLITKIRNGHDITEEYNKLTYKDLILVIKNNLFTPVELEIEESNYTGPLTLNGIIYVEGNLVISGRFKFNGIIILKGSDSKIIVNTDSKPSIRGIILTEGESDFVDDIDLKYASDYVYKYGVYIPGFIDIKNIR